MIGSALVGTFLGVLLAYGIVSPLASRLEQIVEEDGEIYHVAKAIIISSLFGNPQPIVIEAARTSISHKNQPGFAEVFDGLRAQYCAVAQLRHRPAHPPGHPPRMLPPGGAGGEGAGTAQHTR